MPLARCCKSWIKQIVVQSASSMPAQWAARHINRRSTIFLMYHGICPDDHDTEAWTLVRQSSFREQMRFLKDAFECISIDEALKRDGTGARRPAAVVTFDDGYANNLEIALPVLVELAIPAAVYVTTHNVLERCLFWNDTILLAARKSAVRRIDLQGIADPLGCYSFDGAGEEWYESVAAIWEDVKRVDPNERDSIVERIVARFRETKGSSPFQLETEGNVFTPLTRAQVARLADDPLITIGAHSHAHDLLDRIPLVEAERSIGTSKQILQNLTGREVRHFSYPNGNYNPAVIDALKRAGFVSSATTRNGYFMPGSSPYEISRYGVGAWTTQPLFRAMCTGILERMRGKQTRRG